MLRQRLVFGPLMIAVLLAVVYVDDQLTPGRMPPGLLMLGCFLLIIAPAARELSRIFRATLIETDARVIWLGGAVICVLVYLLPDRIGPQRTVAIYGTAVAGIFFLSVGLHGRKRDARGVVKVAAGMVLALVYLGALPGFYLLIRQSHSAWVVAALVLTCKSCDIGAYAAGRALGRHQLIGWLSPGKTWEGFIGGGIASALVATGFAAAGDHAGLIGRFPWWYAATAGLLIGIGGQAGDLVASGFKRDAQIKDSGVGVPGFGGVLDVIDSPIVVAPLAYWVLIVGPALGIGPAP